MIRTARHELVLLLALVPFVACSTSARPSPAPSQAPTAQVASRFERVADVARGAVEQGQYAGTSYLVMKDGRIAAEGAFGFADLDAKTPMKVDTIVRVYSMS